MFNKNPFGIAVSGAANSLAFPEPGATVQRFIKCMIDKKNLDAKNPPANPFKV